jgi:hypothetical protein
MAAVDCFFQEDKMSESELVRDLVQEGIRQAMQLEALKNIRFLINTAWFAIMITPVILALIRPPGWRGISFRLRCRCVRGFRSKIAQQG